MPVPTPRTIQPLSETGDEALDHDNIPDDWKDDGEVIIQRCKPMTNLIESVIAQESWTIQSTDAIPEESDNEDIATKNEAVKDTITNAVIEFQDEHVDSEPETIPESDLVLASPIDLKIDVDHREAAATDNDDEDYVRNDVEKGPNSPLPTPNPGIDIIKSNESFEENIEFNIKDMRQFWEVATSPIKLSPTSTPPSSKSPQSWKSMPNLAKDMATQTSVENVESESTDTSDEPSDATDLTATNKNLAVESQSQLLTPIEERKKAFIIDDNTNFELKNRPSKMACWKSMPSLNSGSKSSVTKSNPPLPLVGSNYPSQKENIQIIEPVKKMKETFEFKTPMSYQLPTKLQISSQTNLTSTNANGPSVMSLSSSFRHQRSSSVGSNESSLNSPVESEVHEDTPLCKTGTHAKN